MKGLSISPVAETLLAFLVVLIWFSLPQGDKKGRTSKSSLPRDVLPGDNLHAERRPGPPCAEVRRDVVSEATVVRNCGGVVVREQCGGSGDGGSDF